MPPILLSKQYPISEEDWKYYLNFKPSDYIRQVAAGLTSYSRFFTDKRFQKLLYHYAFDKGSCVQAQFTIPENTPRVFYRARIYKEDDAFERMAYPEKYGMFQGYDAGNSSVPPTNQWAGQGRINPEGINYLYTSSDIHTCMLEVRAQTGEYVSVAEIKLQKTKHMMDFRNKWSAIEAGEQSDWINSFIVGIQNVFQNPYIKNGDYFLCQYISEFYKMWGFDGVIFHSSKVADTLCADRGINYTFFNYEDCKVILSKLHYIISTKLEFE